MKKILIYTLVCFMLTACSAPKAPSTIATGDLTSYPIETDVTLTYFREPPVSLSTMVSNYGETEFAKEFSKRTGVSIEYIQPASGQMAETFSLMVASGEYPDIIEVNWMRDYPGGPVKAIQDGIIRSLDEYKQYAPALFSILESNKEYARQAKTDDGEYYGFPMIQEGAKLTCTTGPAVRSDWLRELNLDAPETIEEWETMLTAFKEQKNASAPLSFNYTNGSYYMFTLLESVPEMYIENGEVKYGPIQPAYKNALAILNRWYQNGLLDKNIVSVDDKILGSQILNDATGASFLSGGREIGQYMASGVGKNPGFELMGVRYPSAEKGKNNSWMPVTFPVSTVRLSAISEQCKTPEIAAKVLDYLYTEEGQIFSNFGVKGVTYTVENGIPTYTDLIKNNSEGLTMSQALAMNVKAGSSGSFVVSEEYLNQYYQLPQQKNALNEWIKGYEESFSHRIPAVTPRSEEASEYAAIMSEITKYVNQMVSRFLMGIEPLENFETYVEAIQKLKIDRAVAIQQAAYDRYESR